MTRPFSRFASFCAAVLFVVAFSSLPSPARDRTQVGNNIVVGADEEVSEATCFGCTIRVRGRVASDATAIGGSVVLEDQGQVGGDVTVFGGNIRIDRGVKVGGDVTVFGGRLRRDPAAIINGDVNAMGGPAWIILLLIAPLAIFGAFLALIVWLVRRIFRPAVPAVAEFTARPITTAWYRTFSALRRS